MSEARETVVNVDPYSIPLEDIDVSNPTLYMTDSHWPYFERLRKEAPVHYCKSSLFGPYWSVTRFEDIMEVEKNVEVFSSFPTIVIGDQDPEFTVEQFIALDPPKHDAQRKAVTAAVSPHSLAQMESLIRSRVAEIMDGLPIGEPFNWVDRVSIELTTQMLATLFDFPFEDRRKLTFWSDMATSSEEIAGDDSVSAEERQAALMGCIEEFTAIWNERAKQSPEGKHDFITLMAHSPSFQNMPPLEFLGNLILLIVGGNDTTRNSISGGVVMLNENPSEYAKLKADPTLIPNMVSEIIRFQTPLMHMRRTATQDTVLGGQHIKKGDKVVMWYVSANRDDTKIDRPDEFIIDRPNARNHMSFGFGVHRCMGNRLAEMQLRIVWEEIMQRFERVEMVAPPERLKSNFVRGITDLQVVLHPKAS
ncbi:MAG: cytochrome P450 [Pseudomonadales bacterium]|nr:cytochrome P450 [Pseudomonadales bacterium]